MITEKQFMDYIDKLSDSYEETKDAIYANVDNTLTAMDVAEKLSKFRDIACTALREAFVTKNFDQN